jgi:hypothetical protein
MRRALLLSTLIVPSALLTACFDDDDVVAVNGADGGSEAAPHGDAGPDSPLRESGSDSSSNPDSNGGHDVGQPPPGMTALAPGMNLSLWGVTSDGYAIYSSGPSAGDAATSTITVSAVPIAGGASIPIATVSQDSSGVVAGPLLELYIGTDASAAGTLETWTAKGGLHTVSSSAYVFLSGAASNNYGKSYSSDYGLIAYLANYDATAQTADAYVANIDGTGATLLQSGLSGVVAGVNINSFPQLMFVGSDVVLVYVTGSIPTGPTATIESFAPPSWSSTVLATNATEAANLSDPTGAHILYNATSGLEAVAVSGGASTLIDPNGAIEQTVSTESAFTSDGTSVVYASDLEELVRSTIEAPSPTTLVSSNVWGLLALSSDNSTAVVTPPVPGGMLGGAFPNLSEASATTSGSLITLCATYTGAVPGTTVAIGSPFTNDDSHVLFYTGETMSPLFGSSLGPYVGTLESAAVGSSSTVTLATNSYTVFASGKTKVVFDDGFSSTSSAMATVDIKSVDTATSASPTLVVSQANYGLDTGSFFLTPDGTQIVFTTNATSSGGVYVTPVP